MEFVRHLLVFLHLLGMGLLLGTLLLQLRTPNELNKGWLHGSGLQLVTGIALMALAPLTDAHYNHAKLGVKLTVVVVILVLAFVYLAKRACPRWLAPTLGGLVVLNVGLAVFWS
ncbi:hypothetical protein V5P93_006663 [Actinokineospora auranticolor]|uniref:Integral membrane protein n=1 Tax=Actinokineospora auranticolor TaxID=155976 RepID=A0A2S6GWU7_9PSEU|nr:hypothetical protein [Actinokineospora auranticolor]PPK69694.1 hypothetical protein CLV40_103304 [Actinokineospora auranticolor]